MVFCFALYKSSENMISSPHHRGERGINEITGLMRNHSSFKKKHQKCVELGKTTKEKNSNKSQGALGIHRPYSVSERVFEGLREKKQRHQTPVCGWETPGKEME